jgi:MFS family permease
MQSPHLVRTHKGRGGSLVEWRRARIPAGQNLRTLPQIRPADEKEGTMKRSTALIIDAVINFALGILLVLLIPFPDRITQLLGVPAVENGFYPGIFGGVLIGIGIALVLESRRKDPGQLVGLGLGGAIAINLSGGAVLLGWLLFGKLELPLRGSVFLWIIAVALVAVSTVELILHLRKKN